MEGNKNGTAPTEEEYFESNCDRPGDEGDAWGLAATSRRVVGTMPVERDAMHYNMQHQRRGTAIIFNHENFDNTSLAKRAGTEKDSLELKSTLQYYGFEVTIHQDLRWKEMEYVIEKVSNDDHSTADCLVMVVLSHGEEGRLFAKDMPYKPERLWTPFTADQCPSLAGKPKLFFIQACQGDRLDSGITLCRTQTDGFGGLSYKIPTHADFLIAYSTIPGFYSWRNTQRGSWFMQAFCKLLRTEGYNYDLLTLLTLVCQRVAVEFESNSSQPHMHGQKQIPCITTMLTRLVKFTPKSVQL